MNVKISGSKLRKNKLERLIGKRKSHYTQNRDENNDKKILHKKKRFERF